MNRCRMSVATAVLATALAASTITPAAAEPATTVRYPTGASATRLSGYAFDTCAAPPLTTMQTWKFIALRRGRCLRRRCEPQLQPAKSHQ